MTVNELIQQLQEIEDEPDIQRVGAGEPFWYIRLEDCGVNVVQCNEPIGRSCYDITETIGTRLFRNNNYFLSKERAEEVTEKIEAVLKVERMHDAFCPELVDGTGKDVCYVGFDLKHRDFAYALKEMSDLLIVAEFDSRETATKACRILDRKKTKKKEVIILTSAKYEPPCKAGDTVYVIVKDKNAREVYQCKVVKVLIANKPDYSILYLVHNDVFDFPLVVPFSDIGTTVFFSEAEALTARRNWLERECGG